MIFFDNWFISYNDFGNENIFYELDLVIGEIIRIVIIDNVVNVDWEDIC